MASAEVVVTGVGVVSALGWGVEPFWRGLLAGRCGLAPIRRFATARQGGLGGEVSAPPPSLVARSPAGRRMDWASLMAVGACRLALEDAGLNPPALVPGRTALGLGSAYGNLQETATFLDRLAARGGGNPLLFPNLVFNASVSYASIELGITGETAMFSMLEASGEAAIAWGADLVAEARADVCLVGGVDELGAVLYRILDDGGQIARDVPRPFDPDATGAVPAEGAAVLVLESGAHARGRGARILARVVPGPCFVVPAPVHGWARDAAPLADRLAPGLEDADAVLASASGDPARDTLEAALLARALDGRPALVTAIRGAIGEFGAAGALTAGAAVCALADGVVPPTVGLRPPARAGLQVVVGAARRLALRTVVVLGLARGGVCRALRFEAP
jgi:3-oxoacyl-[acyl-carrier-protein] synthase II